MSRNKSIFLLLFVLSIGAQAQLIDVRGRFYSDSVKIGETVPFSLTARYPKELNLLFPDSSFSFSPFEISKRAYFSTHTVGPISYDSVVYFLSTYEIDSLQLLRLPVFLLHTSDCTSIFSQPDSIHLKHVVAHVPDSVAAPQLPLKTQTSYLHVKWLFNYPFLLLGLGILLALGIAAWVIFGKRIRTYFRIKRLQRQHQLFLERFARATEQLVSGYSPRNAESALSLWKEYMETLESKPFTKFTSKEISQLEKDELLNQALRSVDRMVYAGYAGDFHSFEDLKKYSLTRFTRKLEEVKYE